jgi:hypothetical protein
MSFCIRNTFEEDAYNNFTKGYPSLEHRLKPEEVAAYLGVVTDNNAATRVMTTTMANSHLHGLLLLPMSGLPIHVIIPQYHHTDQKRYDRQVLECNALRHHLLIKMKELTDHPI